jgi:hypothetical protein
LKRLSTLLALELAPIGETSLCCLLNEELQSFFALFYGMLSMVDFPDMFKDFSFDVELEDLSPRIQIALWAP